MWSKIFVEHDIWRISRIFQRSMTLLMRKKAAKTYGPQPCDDPVKESL